MGLSEEEKAIAKILIDSFVGFYKTRDPKYLEPLKDIIFFGNGEPFHFTPGSTEEIIANIEGAMLVTDMRLKMDREEYKKKYGERIKEITKENIKPDTKIYPVVIMEDKAIKVIQIPDWELKQFFKYLALMEAFYYTRDIEYLEKIVENVIVDVNGEIHFPEENPYFILINYDKLKEAMEKFNI